ncbi:hypothetical protein GCM10023187_52910 [Nibrella viscosa]|uniref:Sporulation related domain-containing protein n=1 Tax=Nibrella viscosa TaxID=1084524 RepID=A0ABP8L032_9BACT
MKTLFCLFAFALLMAANQALPAKSAASGGRGYYYAIVFNNKPAQVQFSTAFFADCQENTLYQRIANYAQNNGYGQYRLVGPFAQTEVEAARQYAKQQWYNSGYAVAGDNNYVGDCY